MTPFQIILYCGLLLSISAFSVDILLPAFGLISTGLAAPYEQVQLTIPIFLAAIGVGQIFTGPLSDRFGRKPVLMTGLLVFVLGTMLCAFAWNGETLLTGRAVQGLGASAGPVVARAVLRDLFSGRELASNLALAMMVFSFGPIVAPLAGVGLLQLGDWRMIFLAILAFGLVLLAIGILTLPETICKREPSATRPRVFLANASKVLNVQSSRVYGLLLGPIMTLMMLILISVPRVYDETYGITGALFAVLFALHGTGIIAGQWLNRRIIASHGPMRALLAGALIGLSAPMVMAVLKALDLLNAYTLSATLILFALGFLTMASNAMALALDPHPTIAGFASSFFESVSRIVSAALATVFALYIGGDLLNFIIVLGFTTLVVLGLIMLAERRTSL